VLYITIAEGENAADAQTIFASSDVALIEAVGKAIARRLGIQTPDRLLRVAKSPRPATPGPDDERGPT
jgi:hypothetical protein